MKYERTFDAARAENREHPYVLRRFVREPVPRNFDWLLPAVPPAGIAFGMLVAAVFWG